MKRAHDKYQFTSYRKIDGADYKDERVWAGPWLKAEQFAGHEQQGFDLVEDASENSPQRERPSSSVLASGSDANRGRVVDREALKAAGSRRRAPPSTPLAARPTARVTCPPPP
ncbi:hypothetical protein [Sorangium sp. So ce363]|uniref:hypothetical protein n=1 Tax=Sorangium sp. So ce363 TaxID=3133304 RepID=UPI003F61ADA4